MGGNQTSQQQGQSNPIIPDTGAAAYWYTDPRAAGVPGPGTWNPNAEQGADRPDVSMNNRNDYFNLLMSQLYQQMKMKTEYDPTIDTNAGYTDSSAAQEGVSF